MNMKIASFIISIPVLAFGIIYNIINYNSSMEYLSSNEVSVSSVEALSLSERLSSQESVNIVSLGDSVTAGTSFSEGNYVISETNYTNVLESLLTAEYGYGDINIENYGVPGSLSETATDYYDEIVAATPDLVIIMFGINDYIWNVPIDNYYSNLVQAANYIRSQGIEVLLMSPTPTLYQYDADTSINYLEYVATAQKAAQVTGSYYLDINSEIVNYLNGESIYTVMEDGIHFNEDQYKIISEYVFEYIKTI